jgi:hypothetical protein
MAGIYAGSLCTLSSATASAQAGCVFPRPDEYAAPIEWQIVSTVDKEASPAILLYPPPVAYWRLEEVCLINTRAWCYQEKELSRRFVQYTRNYFAWQCGERKVSEAKTVEYVSRVTGTLSLDLGHNQVYFEILEPEESSTSDVVSKFNQWYEYIKSPLEPVITIPATGEDSHMSERLPPMHVSGRLVEAAPMFHENHSVGVDPECGLQFCDQRITFPVGLRPVLDWAVERWRG